MQRFGTGDVRTHTVGIEVLKKNWKGVVELIIGTADFDNRVTKAKR